VIGVHHLSPWLLCLTLLMGPVWAIPHDTEHGLPKGESLLSELTQLENGFQPHRDFQARVQGLSGQIDATHPLYGRLVSLQCWAQPAENTSDYSAAITFASQQLQQARARQDKLTEIALLNCRGWHNQLLGEMTNARRDYDAAFKLAEAAGAQRLMADALSYRGNMQAYQGQLAAGLKDQLVAHDLYERLGLEAWRLHQLGEIANTYRRMEVFDRALEYFKELENAYLQQGDEENLNDIRAQLGILYSDTGRHAEALALFTGAASYFKGKGWSMDEAWALTEVAHSQLKLGRVNEALVHLQQAETLLNRKQETDAATLGQWRLVMGLAEEAHGRLNRALYFLAVAEPIFIQEHNKRFLGTIYRVQARILEKQGEAAAALASLKRYVAIREALERDLGAQRSIQMRFEFDLARKEVENENLKTHQALQAQLLDRVQERRYWQTLVTVLALLLLGSMVLYQLSRSRKMRRLAMTDELTGIHNRRQIQAKAQTMLQQAKSLDQPFSLLLIDIDHFKQINDGWGHQAGDRVLVAVANCISEALRSLDRVGRNGGEEFLVLLPDTLLAEAVEVAERVRQQVAALQVAELPAEYPVRVSIGCAQLREGESLSELIHRADEAMYSAKQGGRNRVCRAD
jgi:diguanylate cyclase (GGDEF)-like protein